MIESSGSIVVLHYAIIGLIRMLCQFCLALVTVLVELHVLEYYLLVC